MNFDEDQLAELSHLMLPRMVDQYMPHIPHPAQQVFMTLNIREALFGGAAGGGKSDALLMAALQYVDVPGYSALLLRRTYADLALPGAIMDRLSHWLRGTDAHPRNKGVQWVFPSGARITFGYLQHSNDKYRYQCFAPDHELLTAEGWKWVEDVTTTDLCATVNPWDGIMEYRPVTRTYSYEADSLYAIVTNKGTQLVTHNHTLWYSIPGTGYYKRKRADRLPIGSLIPTAFGYRGEVTVDNKTLDEALEHWRDTGTFPESVWKWSARSARNLVMAIRRSTGKHYFAKPEQLDQLHRLCVHGGVEAKILNDKIRDGLSFPNTAHGEYGLARLKYKETVDYRGPVHCVEVPPYHTLVTRHRGAVSISGNSAEYQFVAFDELSQFSKEDYEYLFSRLRKPTVRCLACDDSLVRQGRSWKHHHEKTIKCSSLVPDPRALEEYRPATDGTTLFDVPLRMRSATNPGGIGGPWVKGRFVDSRTKKKTAIFVPALLRDNPSLNREEYEESLSHLGPVERQRLLDGDWEVEAEGGMFQRHWFKVVEEAPAGMSMVRAWDMAGTPGAGDWTVGLKLGKDFDGRWYILDIRRGQWTPHEVEQVVATTAQEDGRGVNVFIEQEPGSSGKAIADHYQRKVLSGYPCYVDRPTGSKEVRARPVSSAAQAGNVYVLPALWNGEFLDEMQLFPNGAHDDQVDALAHAMGFLTGYSDSIIIA